MDHPGPSKPCAQGDGGKRVASSWGLGSARGKEFSYQMWDHVRAMKPQVCKPRAAHTFGSTGSQLGTMSLGLRQPEMRGHAAVGATHRALASFGCKRWCVGAAWAPGAPCPPAAGEGMVFLPETCSVRSQRQPKHLIASQQSHRRAGVGLQVPARTCSGAAGAPACT